MRALLVGHGISGSSSSSSDWEALRFFDTLAFLGAEAFVVDSLGRERHSLVFYITSPFQ